MLRGAAAKHNVFQQRQISKIDYFGVIELRTSGRISARLAIMVAEFSLGKLHDIYTCFDRPNDVDFRLPKGASINYHQPPQGTMPRHSPPRVASMLERAVWAFRGPICPQHTDRMIVHRCRFLERPTESNGD